MVCINATVRTPAALRKVKCKFIEEHTFVIVKTIILYNITHTTVLLHHATAATIVADKNSVRHILHKLLKRSDLAKFKINQQQQQQWEAAAPPLFSTLNVTSVCRHGVPKKEECGQNPTNCDVCDVLKSMSSNACCRLQSWTWVERVKNLSERTGQDLHQSVQLSQKHTLQFISLGFCWERSNSWITWVPSVFF